MLLRIGDKLLNTDQIVEANTERIGERVRVAIETTATSYDAGALDQVWFPAPHQIVLWDEEARAFIQWLDANATNLTPQTPEDQEWEAYRANDGDMTRPEWERTRNQLQALSESLEHMSPDSPSWERQMERASELEVRLGY